MGALSAVVLFVLAFSHGASAQDGFVPVCERSPQVRLRLEDIFELSCSQITREQLRALRGGLSLDGLGIRELRVGDFSDLTSLVMLALGDNQISAIEPGTFTGLQSLRWLNLSQNQITSIEPEDLRGMPNLDFLDLAGNQIRSIEPGDFQFVSELTELYLVSNQLAILQASALANLVHLERLSLFGNNSLRFEENAFAGLENLEGLNIARIGASLADVPLAELKRLRIVQVGGEDLEHIPDGFFLGFTFLTVDIVSMPPLSRTSPAAFRGVTVINLPPSFAVDAEQSEWSP